MRPERTDAVSVVVVARVGPHEKKRLLLLWISDLEKVLHFRSDGATHPLPPSPGGPAGPTSVCGEREAHVKTQESRGTRVSPVAHLGEERP